MSSDENSDQNFSDQKYEYYKKKYHTYKEKYIKSLKKLSQLQSQSKDKISDVYKMLDKPTKKFVDTLEGSMPIYKMSISDARNVLNGIQNDESYKYTVDIDKINIPIATRKKSNSNHNPNLNNNSNFKSENIKIKIFRPKNNKSYLPIIIYYHGGGWVLGNSQTHGRLMAELANKITAAVVYVGYTPAPEKKYPAQLVEAEQALKYITNNGTKYNLDTRKIVIMGDSVGGNMATIISLLAVERQNPIIKYQVLLYPVTDASMATESYQTYSNGPWLTKKSMNWFFDSYEKNADKRLNPLISPLNISPKYLHGLPPTLIIYGENDPLRSEVEAYAHKLMTANVDVTAVKYLGTIHDFLMLDPLQDSPAAKSAIKLIVSHVKDIFYGDYY